MLEFSLFTKTYVAFLASLHNYYPYISKKL